MSNKSYYAIMKILVIFHFMFEFQLFAQSIMIGLIKPARVKTRVLRQITNLPSNYTNPEVPNLIAGGT